MRPASVSSADSPENTLSPTSPPSSIDGQSFDKALKAASMEYSTSPPMPQLMSDPRPISAQDASPFSSMETPKPATSQAKAAAAYKQTQDRTSPTPPAAVTTPSTAPTAPTAPAASAATVATASQLSDFGKYKDDQLLRNPGGRDYYLDQKAVIPNAPEQKSFISRIGKDISSALGNIKNFAGNIFLGSKFLYRGQNNEILEGRQKGLLQTFGNFFKDLGSALTFGAWHPDESQAPKGFGNRMVYASSKLKDAVLGGLIEGVPASLTHMGKNLVLAGWHLAEVVPDATIGNFDAGRKLTTSIFDNGHVLVEYITDVMPFGDAWLRVHSSNFREFQPPLLYNLKMPERYMTDARWNTVRNTPFRKTIESLGALLGDAAALGLIGQTGFSSNRHNALD